MSTEALDILKSQAVGRITLWSGSDRNEVYQMGGHFYRFPPQGECLVADRRDHQWNKNKTFKLTGKPTVMPEGYDARSTAEELIKKYGWKGLTVLLDDGDDERRKREARRVYLEWRVNFARQTQQSWLEKVRTATKGGGLPPVQPKGVREEIEFLERYEAGLVDRKRYISRVDGFESDDRSEVVAWHAEKYPDEVRNQGADALIMDLWEGKAGRRPKPPEELDAETPPPEPESTAIEKSDIVLLISRATQLGVDLGEDETRAILEGDIKVAQKVSNRLKAAVEEQAASSQANASRRRKATGKGRRQTRRRRPAA